SRSLASKNILTNVKLDLLLATVDLHRRRPIKKSPIEPVNFAFIQRNGVPAGPPSPQLSDLSTVTPNSQTLMMNPGDVIRTHMWDASIGGGKRAFRVQL